MLFSKFIFLLSDMHGWYPEPLTENPLAEKYLLK